VFCATVFAVSCGEKPHTCAVQCGECFSLFPSLPPVLARPPSLPPSLPATPASYPSPPSHLRILFCPFHVVEFRQPAHRGCEESAQAWVQRSRTTTNGSRDNGQWSQQQLLPYRCSRASTYLSLSRADTPCNVNAQRNHSHASAPPNEQLRHRVRTRASDSNLTQTDLSPSLRIGPQRDQPVARTLSLGILGHRRSAHRTLCVSHRVRGLRVPGFITTSS